MKLRNVLGMGLIAGLSINAMAQYGGATKSEKWEGSDLTERQDASIRFRSMTNRELTDQNKSPTYMKIYDTENMNHEPFPNADAPPYQLSFMNLETYDNNLYKGNVTYDYRNSINSAPAHIKIDYWMIDGKTGPQVIIGVHDQNSTCSLYNRETSSKAFKVPLSNLSKVKDISLLCRMDQKKREKDTVR